MNTIEQARFNPLYKQMLQALVLQGKRPIMAIRAGLSRNLFLPILGG